MAAGSDAERASRPKECVVGPAREVVVEQRAVVEVARQRTAAAIGVGRRLDIALTCGECRNRSGKSRGIGARRIARATAVAAAGHDIDRWAAIVVLSGSVTRIIGSRTIAPARRPREVAAQ